MTDQPTPAPADSSERLAADVECAIGLNVGNGGSDGVTAARDAVLAVVQPELDRLARLAEQAEQEANATATAAAHLTTLARERAETAEHRLRLAHRARRAKEQQLDGMRRALCDVGAMQDDDPYSHADLEDVIRQAFAPLAPAHDAGPTTITDPAYLREQYARALHDADEHSCQLGEGADYAALADAVLRVRDRHLDQLRQRLELADQMRRDDAHDAGPTVAECAEADRRWPLEKHGE